MWDVVRRMVKAIWIPTWSSAKAERESKARFDADPVGFLRSIRQGYDRMALERLESLRKGAAR